MGFKFQIVCFAFAVCFISCKSDNQSNATNHSLGSHEVRNLQGDQPQPVGLPPHENPNTVSSFEDLKARAMDEGDYIGRASSALRLLQLEYKKCEGKVTGFENVTILLDNLFNMTIKNEFQNVVTETIVNLKNLDYSDKGMTLIPDTGKGTFPGIKVCTNDGKDHVRILKNGSLIKEQQCLEIYMVERGNIERLTPALIQALMVAQGKS
jgi:hypothetical protein